MVNSIVLAIMEELSYYIQGFDLFRKAMERSWTIWFCSQPAKSPMVGFILWDEFPLIIAGSAGGRLRTGMHYRSQLGGKHEHTHVEYYAGMEPPSFGEGEGRVVDGLSAIEV